MNNKPSELDAFLNLPTDPQKSGSSNDDKTRPEEENPAADLIRQKVDAAYTQEPNASEEVADLNSVAPEDMSRHQKFIYELTNSGKSLAEIQMAWHDYYAGLPDDQKHEVWQEFYTSQVEEAKHPSLSRPNPTIEASKTPTMPKTKPQFQKPMTAITRTLADLREHVQSIRPRPRTVPRKGPIHSAVFGLATGSLVILIVLFSFFNERFIAPFIQPSRSLSNVPLISDAAIGRNPEVIIPKINVEIPVVYGVKTIDEASVDNALESGVVHYADTAVPGQDGNVVIVGHSSNNIFNKGKYKFAFVLLSRMEPGDTFYLQKDGKRYTYQIYQKKIVKPDDTSVLSPTDKPAVATLITCDPPGTSINRLVVTGEQISPDVSTNTAKTSNDLATQTKIIPGNSQSLWARFWSALSH